MLVPTSLSHLYSVLDPSSWDAAAHIQGGSSPPPTSHLNLSGNTLTDISKDVSPRRFQMHPGNRGDKPSHSGNLCFLHLFLFLLENKDFDNNFLL